MLLIRDVTRTDLRIRQLDLRGRSHGVDDVSDELVEQLYGEEEQKQLDEEEVQIPYIAVNPLFELPFILRELVNHRQLRCPQIFNEFETVNFKLL